VIEDLAALQFQNTNYQQKLMHAYTNLGDINLGLGDLKAAQGWYDQALALGEQLLAADPKGLTNQDSLASAYNSYAELHKAMGQLAAAGECRRKALKLFESLRVADPHNMRFHHAVARTYQILAGQSKEMGEPQAAQEYYTKALVQYQELEAISPIPRARLELAQVYNNFGHLNCQLGQLAAAREYLRPALDRAQDLVKAAPKNFDVQFLLAMVYLNSADTEMQALDFAQAARWMERSVAVLQDLDAQGKLKDKPYYQSELRKSQKKLQVFKAAERAVNDLDFALAQPLEQATELLTQRTRALAARGQHPQALETAEKLRALAAQSKQPANTLYDAACCYAHCVRGVTSGSTSGPLTSGMAAIRHGYMQKALDTLTEAVQQGFRNAVHLETDPDLALIRHEAAYQKLIKQLKERPAQPKPR
jgi:tetratricopeptide (TPR) repeat protein